MLLITGKCLGVTPYPHSVFHCHHRMLCAETKVGFKGQDLHCRCLPVLPEHIRPLKIHRSH